MRQLPLDERDDVTEVLQARLERRPGDPRWRSRPISGISRIWR